MQLPQDKQSIVERHNKVVYDCGDTVVKVFNASKPAAGILNEALNLTRAAELARGRVTEKDFLLSMVDA